MKIRSLHAAAAACAFSMLPATLHAQVGRPVAQPQNAPVQPGQVVPPGQIIKPGQTIRPGQPITPGQTIRNGNVTNPQDGRNVQANAGSQQGSHSVENFLVKKMMLCNKAVVELGQMAVDKANSDEVKQFAQMLVQEHQQLNQQLSKMTSTSQPGQGQQPGQRQQPGQGQQNDQGDQERTQGTITAGPGNDGRTGTQGQQGGQGQRQDQQVPQQLTTIVQDAHAKQLEMAREMLNNEEGHDFDMAYLGMTIASHTAALAELQSIQNVGSQEFQQLVRTAEKKTSDHLERAKELASNLKDKKDR